LYFSSGMKMYGPNMLAAFAAAMLTRECNRRAFHKSGRSMITTDMINEIGGAFHQLYEHETMNLD